MLMRKPSSKRFIELDILRGFVIILMVFLHILWDLDYFGIIPLNENIYQFNIICPTLFFILLGMCLVVSKNKYRNQSSYEQKRYNKGYCPLNYCF